MLGDVVGMKDDGMERQRANAEAASERVSLGFSPVSSSRLPQTASSEPEGIEEAGERSVAPIPTPPPSTLWSEPPPGFTESWLKTNTNAALRTERDLHYAIDRVQRARWPLHADRTKNWDAYIALRHVLDCVTVDDWVLDAGADRVSSFLPTLAWLGYRNLLGLNLLEPGPSQVGGITYNHGNIEWTKLEDEAFAFVACLSTIEHDVDVVKFLGEAARILKPGGHLFISTDFWREPIVTPVAGWRIFTPHGIMSIIDQAAKVGLYLTSEGDLAVIDRVCHHAGLDYTFVNLLFEKRGA